jgi:hypothetical protein
MLVMVWRWSRPRGEDEAREGEFHGLMLDCCCPPGGWRGCAGGTKLPRARRYHSKFSNSQSFLILFCKEFQNGTNISFCTLLAANVAQVSFGVLRNRSLIALFLIALFLIALLMITCRMAAEEAMVLPAYVGALDRKMAKRICAHHRASSGIGLDLAVKCRRTLT